MFRGKDYRLRNALGGEGYDEAPGGKGSPVSKRREMKRILFRIFNYLFFVVDGYIGANIDYIVYLLWITVIWGKRNHDYIFYS